MGQYHYLVNLDKKEIIHPHQIGNGLKLYEQIRWNYATSTALVMLLVSSSKEGERGGGDFRASHPLIGSWAGDRIAFIGDYAEADDSAESMPSASISNVRLNGHRIFPKISPEAGASGATSHPRFAR